MKKLLPIALACISTLTVGAEKIFDYCGQFKCSYIDQWGTKTMRVITIEESRKANKVTITNLYNTPHLGSLTFEADIDIEAGTLTIPYTNLIYYDFDGLELYFGTWENDGLTNLTKEPVVAILNDGDILFNPDDAIIFGGYSENTEECWLYQSLANLKLERGGNSYFEYDPEDWTAVGTAEYPDLCFGYKIFDTLEPVVSTVTVALNKKDPKKVALLNPYMNTKWASVNKDSNGVGQIVIDLNDPDFVIMEPFVYSGFDYDYGGLKLGKTYVYNIEGHTTRIQGMTIEQATEYLNSNYQEISTFSGNTIHIGYGAMLFSTENQPTALYSFTDMEGEIVFDDDVVKAMEEAGKSGVETITVSDDSEAEYYDLTGCRVSHPAKGQIYICRKGGKAKKVVF